MAIFQMLQGSLTLLIAFIATYIAWQQWKANELKLRLERYDRRLKIYEEIITLLSLIAQEANVSYDVLLKFRGAAAEADFLFTSEIPQYIDEIYKRGVKLSFANSQYKDSTQERPADYDSKKIVYEMNNQMTWFLEQFSVVKEKFKKYLDISK